MGNLTLNGATSGQITLAPPSVAGTNTISLPAQTATVLTDSSAAMNIGSGQIYKDASGNVGIGTSSPNTKLNLSASSSAGTVAATPSIVLSNRNNTNSTFNSAVIAVDTHRDVANPHYSGAIWFTRIPASSNNSSATDIVFGASTDVVQGNLPTERARIVSTGELLVGTTATWVGDQNSVDGISITGYGAAAFARSNNGVANFNRRGTDGSLIFMQKNGSTVGSISVTGSATAYNTSSDYRLKENVKPMTTGLATIGALKPVTYDWINDKSKGEGFIAHELQTIIPAAVTGEKDAVDEDGKPVHQGVDYSKIVVHLVAAMQEQQSIIEDLKARLAVLEAK